MPSLKWELPAGWEEVPPGEMRLASFRVKGGDKTADLGVFPLPGMAGTDLNNVNRWLAQVGKPNVNEEELAKMAEALEIQGQKGQLYDMAGENPGSGDKTRILAAILRRGGVAWFFKMTGDDTLVAANKPAFMAFLKSLNFGSEGQPELPPSHPPIGGMGGAMGAAAQPGPPGPPNPDRPQLEVPSGWQEVGGGQFLAAKFLISGDQNAQAAVNISVSAGDGGGWMGNVNRWRGQLGLGSASEDEITKMTSAIESGGEKGTLVEFEGKDGKARLVGVMVSKGGKSWFYKLSGSSTVVERERAAFTKFIQTAKYPNAS